jgi:hypothetical protein
VDQRELAARHPKWGPATLLLLVAGVVVGYLSLMTFGKNLMHQCLVAGLVVCDPRVEGLVLALPALATALGLVLSVIGGRILIRLQRSPMPATWAGWTIFVIATIVTYAVAGGLV